MANSIVPNSTHFVGAVEPTNSPWYRTSLELQFYIIDAFLGSIYSSMMILCFPFGSFWQSSGTIPQHSLLRIEISSRSSRGMLRYPKH